MLVPLDSAIPESCQLTAFKEVAACDIIDFGVDVTGFHIPAEVVPMNTKNLAGLRRII